MLVLLNCCSVVLVPAPYEEYSVSSAQQSVGVGGADDCNSPLPRSLRAWFHMAHDHQLLFFVAASLFGSFISALVRCILGACSNHGPVRLLSGAGGHGRS